MLLLEVPHVHPSYCPSRGRGAVAPPVGQLVSARARPAQRLCHERRSAPHRPHAGAGPGVGQRVRGDAIDEALKQGEYWLARLLEREARGRYVQTQVKRQFEYLYDFSLRKGVDVVDPATGTRYEILSGTDSNLARHGRRMAGEVFRMLTF
jgi:hypothetical protein